MTASGHPTEGELRRFAAPDGTSLAVRVVPGDGPPLLLVHGAAADHTTFRVLGPLLRPTHTLLLVDRRGRGGSTDGPSYRVGLESEDLARIAEAIADETGTPVDAFGHSFGGRCVLGAALRTEAIRRVISYEGAPAPRGASYRPSGIDAELAARAAAGDDEGLLVAFLEGVVGMSAADLDAYRSNPVWPARVAAAPTIVRELAAEDDPDASLEALGGVRQPVLQLLGSDSLPIFREATEALDARLADGRIVTIPGARHAAHHTHPDAVVAAVEAFLTGDPPSVRD